MVYNKLRGKIVEVFHDQRAFSNAIGLSEQSITSKMNDRSGFSQKDILKWCNALGIEKEQIGEYFFTEELSKR